MVTTTTNILMQQPAVGGDSGVWGPPLNTNSTYLDQLLGQTVAISFASANADVTVTQANMLYMVLSLTGTPTLTTAQLVLYANMGGRWLIYNQTPNPVTVITAVGGSVGTACAPGTISFVWSDGTNVYPAAASTPIRILTAGASTSLTVRDSVLIVNKSSGSATAVTLPAGGGYFTIKDGKGDAATNNITISGVNIDGAASYIIRTNYGSVTLTYNGTQYNIL